MTRCCFPVRLLLGLFLAGLVAQAAPAADLAVTPREVVFKDAFDGRQLLVSEGNRDVTRAAHYSSSDPAVVRVDERGYLQPASDGSARVTVRQGQSEAAVSVRVSGVGAGRAIDFKTEIVPLLSRLGCNAGGCHGKASGQNGFKLSLFGFDSAFDYEAIVREARGRRLFPAAPARSLILLKATGQVSHGGGKRMSLDGEEYRLVRRWIEAGAPASAPGAPGVVRLHVTPTDSTLRPGEGQQLAVEAEYGDGSRRDVTRQAEYFTNLDVVATVDRDGLVASHQQTGEAAIMARYMGHVTVFRAIVPHGEPLKELPDFKPNNYIDELAAAKWMKLGLHPSP
ncbi:MAG TPA: S-layer protein, partial [Gemmataceae bacterium]|nr:S-layer protein [Gemmataceae bacterium]